MNRELKFRAWHKHLKKMYNVCVLNMENKFVGLEGFERDCKEALGGISYGCDLEFVELMQYIGLKAKDVEIYEGDIVTSSDYPNAKVVWCNDGGVMAHFCFSLLEEFVTEKGTEDEWTIKKGGHLEANYFLDKTSEVIGNVFENPELLLEENK